MPMSSDRFRLPRTGHVALAILGLLFCSQALPQVSIDAKPSASTGEHAAVEVFQGPKRKLLDGPLYPPKEVREYGEGWLKLGFMVNT